MNIVWRTSTKNSRNRRKTLTLSKTFLKKKENNPDLDANEDQEKSGDEETDILRPKNQKPFTVSINGDLEKQDESLIYRPKKKVADRHSHAKERVMDESEETDEESLLREKG